MKKVVLKVTGIKDLNDSLKIEKALSKNNSIKSVLADHKEKSLILKFVIDLPLTGHFPPTSC